MTTHVYRRVGKIQKSEISPALCILHKKEILRKPFHDINFSRLSINIQLPAELFENYEI